jgi:hypothetical protein
MMEAARTSETSVDNYFTRQYIPEDNSERHTRRHENLKSHIPNSVTQKGKRSETKMSNIILHYRGFRQECYNETVLSEARYNGGYLYLVCLAHSASVECGWGHAEDYKCDYHVK